MIAQKTLTSIVLAGALAVSGAGCEAESNDQQAAAATSQSMTKDSQYPTKSISGKIINVDEDSFSWTNVYKRGGGEANFQFEIIRVQDGEGNVKKLLSPVPTSYQIGDNATFNYMERPSIAFSEILRDYGYHVEHSRDEVLQNGLITIDGVLK